MAPVIKIFKSSIILNLRRQPYFPGSRFVKFSFHFWSSIKVDLHDPDIAGSAIIKAKIVVDCSIVDRMVDLMESNTTRATCGKSWESNGSTRCYVYLEGPGRIVNLMKKLVPASGRTLVLAKEGVETGKTWITTFGKLKSKICAYTFEPYESIEHELLRQMLEWMALSKKKTVHVEVGYAYITYCVA